MIFGRRKREVVVESPRDDEVDGLEEHAEEADESDPAEEWAHLDAKDWREEGPFDISEVDLDADDVVRLDLGSLVFTPSEGMGLQLQVEEESQSVAAVLATVGQSAIEIALFAAPKSASMLAEVRESMITDTESAGGVVTLSEGPFGVEVRRELLVTGERGQRFTHLSRTWLVQGPRWLLRGTLVGRAAQESDQDEGEGLELFEFFANTVVRRDGHPVAAGDLIPMRMPEGMATS